MVELTIWQGDDGYGKSAQFWVIDGGVRAKGTAEFGVEVVLFEGGLGG